MSLLALLLCAFIFSWRADAHRSAPERGERIDWLEPVPTGAPALAWRVRQPLQERAALP